jgi:hypothetical protein
MPPEITVWEPRWWLQDIPSKAFHTCNRGSEQFRLASQLQPEDANVEANLGAALAQTGR